jgi:hypothetical protein
MSPSPSAGQRDDLRATDNSLCLRAKPSESHDHLAAISSKQLRDAAVTSQWTSAAALAHPLAPCGASHGTGSCRPMRRDRRSVLWRDRDDLLLT